MAGLGHALLYAGARSAVLTVVVAVSTAEVGGSGVSFTRGEAATRDQPAVPVLATSGDDGAASASGSFTAVISAAMAVSMVSAMAWSAVW